jgi:hypothetical protein
LLFHWSWNSWRGKSWRGKTRNQRNEAYFRFFLQAFDFPPSCNLKQMGCQIKACKKHL